MMRPPSLSRLGLALGLAAASLAGLPFAGPRPAAAESASPLDERAARNLQLGVGKSVIVDLPEDAAEIYVGDPKIANAIVRSARRIYVSAVANGQTTIFALAGDGQRIATIDISVGRDVGELAKLLNAAIPNNDIHVRTVADAIILTGSVASAGDAQKAIDIASGFLPNVGGGSLPGLANMAPSKDGASGASPTTNASGKVINSLTIRGLDEISLRVTVAEIRREIVKQLGVTMSGSGPNGSFTLDNPFAINGALSGTEAALNWAHGSGSFKATLQAFERQGVAHTLAEPTVTAVSGESASFMAGGTIPIPNSQSCTGGLCQIGFIQQPYGVTLKFTPLVLAEGRVQLRIATEVTEIDYSKQLVITGLTIPGFRTRNNITTVELPSGGSIATAGLISAQSEQAINGFPGLMNLPILGALFRSRDYQRNETELLIVVTPYVVHAINPRDVVRPDKNFEDASDPQAWFLGRVNRIYAPAGTLQPMPGYVGKVGFITE
jgi:pilus assembly protein CpaC